MYDDIGLFVEVVKYKSFAKTAEKLNLQQSTVSRRIQDLQNNLKLELLIKKHSGIELTAIGQKFYDSIADSISYLKGIKKQIQETRTSDKGELKLSLSPGLAAVRIDPFLHEFNALYPDIELKLSYSSFKYQPDHNFDLIITANYPQNNNVKTRKIYSTSLVLACSQNYVHRENLPKKLDEIAKHKTAGIRRSGFKPQIINLNNNKIIEDYEFRPNVVFTSLAQTSYLAYYNNYITMCLYDHLKCFNLHRVLPQYQFGTIDFYMIRGSSNNKIIDIFIEFINKIFQRDLIPLL